MAIDFDRAITTLAAPQFGAVSRDQMSAAGLTSRQIGSRVGSGFLLQFSYRSFAVAGSADTFERRATCALLHSPGAALSFDTVAALCGVHGFKREPIHISEPREFRQKGIDIDLVRHRPRFLPSSHLIRVDGFPATSPTRLCADIAYLKANDWSDRRKARAIEAIWAAGLTTRPLLDSMEKQWCERGRRGSSFLHAFLAERPVEFRPGETSLERRFNEIIVDAGFPRPIPQVDSFGLEGWFGRVDVRDPCVPLIGEVDSDRYHLAPLDKADDKRRDEAAEAAGFKIERFTEFEVWYEPASVVARWRASRNELLRRKRDAI